MIRFVTDTPACFIPDIKSLVITDIHLGIEHELWKSGITIPSQAEKSLKTIRRLADSTGAKRLVMLGDLKYKVPGASTRELRDIPRFLEGLSGFVKVDLCKGNHDDNLEAMIPEGIKLHGSGGFRLKSYGFFHGHAWPGKDLMACDHLFMGHLQPAVEFRDGLGHRDVEQVWMKLRLDKDSVRKRYKTDRTGRLNLIVVPSFNRLSGAFVLNSRGVGELNGPLVSGRVADMEKSRLYMLDGTFIGVLGEMSAR